SATSLQEVKPHPEQEPSSPQGWELLWHGGQWWLLLPVTVLVSVFAGLGANVGIALFGAVALTMGVWGLLNSKTANTAKLKRFIGTENRDVGRVCMCAGGSGRRWIPVAFSSQPKSLACWCSPGSRSTEMGPIVAVGHFSASSFR